MTQYASLPSCHKFQSRAGHGSACLFSQQVESRDRYICEFEASQGYIVRPCLKKQASKQTKKTTCNLAQTDIKLLGSNDSTILSVFCLFTISLKQYYLFCMKYYFYRIARLHREIISKKRKNLHSLKSKMSYSKGFNKVLDLQLLINN